MGCFVVSLFASILLLGGCKPSSDAISQGRIRIGILRHESSLPFYVADELGLFKKHGLDVTLIELPPGDHIPLSRVNIDRGFRVL